MKEPLDQAAMSSIEAAEIAVDSAKLFADNFTLL